MRTSERRIFVIHFLGGLRFGGIEKLVYDLVEAQQKSQKLKPQILVLKDQGEFKEKFSQLEIKITAINPRSTYNFSIKNYRTAVNVFKETDLIHFHGFHLIIAVIAFFSRASIVYTEHGNFGFGREVKISDKFNHFLRKCYFKWFVDVVVCNSQFTKGYLKEKWNLSKKNSQISKCLQGFFTA